MLQDNDMKKYIQNSEFLRRKCSVNEDTNIPQSTKEEKGDHRQKKTRKSPRQSTHA